MKNEQNPLEPVVERTELAVSHLRSLCHEALAVCHSPTPERLAALERALQIALGTGPHRAGQPGASAAWLA